MNGDEFVADKVVTRCQCGWDGDGGFKSIEDGVSGPDTFVLGT
jgi:hypothetical protein